MTKKVGCGDISMAIQALTDLIAALRARNVTAGTQALFAFLDELRAAYAGHPLLVSTGPAVAACPCPEDPDEDCWDDCADQCEALKGAFAVRKAGTAGFDWASLMPLILQIISLFAKK